MKRLLLLIHLISLTTAYTQPPVVSFQPIDLGATLSAPVDVVSANDGTNRLFIAQQGGIVRLWNGATLSDFLNVSSTGLNLISTGGEQGLLSIAFHPDYDGVTNRQFFIYYTDGNSDLAVRRFLTQTGNPNAVEAGAGTLILTIPHPGQTNHNGAKLNFGPDGYLYFATGDGGGGNDPSNNAQNGNSLLGKMLRIDINNTSVFGNYAVPATNPFITNPNIDDRIWAIGLRNPFRWSFDRLTGDMWIGDVGQSAQEEVHFRAAASTGGVNYGWRCFEGYIPTPGLQPCTLNPVPYVPPVYDYANPGSGPSSVTGGHVYRGTEYPNFRGYYLAADVYSGQLHFLWPNGSGAFDSSTQAGGINGIVGFGEGEDGTLYAVSLFNNALYKVVATGGTALSLRFGHLQASRRAEHVALQWSVSGEEAVSRYHVEFSENGTSFQAAGTTGVNSNASGRYQFRHLAAPAGSLYYRVAAEKQNGQRVLSTILLLPGDGVATASLFPSIVRNRQVVLRTGTPAERLTLVNSSGQLVYSMPLSGFQGVQNLYLPALPKGYYLAQIFGTGGWLKTEKLLIE